METGFVNIKAHDSNGLFLRKNKSTRLIVTNGLFLIRNNHTHHTLKPVLNLSLSWGTKSCYQKRHAGSHQTRRENCYFSLGDEMGSSCTCRFCLHHCFPECSEHRHSCRWHNTKELSIVFDNTHYNIMLGVQSKSYWTSTASSNCSNIWHCRLCTQLRLVLLICQAKTVNLSLWLWWIIMIAALFYVTHFLIILSKLSQLTYCIISSKGLELFFFFSSAQTLMNEPRVQTTTSLSEAKTLALCVLWWWWSSCTLMFFFSAVLKAGGVQPR